MKKKSIFFAAFLVSGCGEPLCKNQLIYEVESPEQDYIASIFQRNCGATTPVINVVNVQRKKEILDFENYNNWAFTAHGESSVTVSWKANNDLLISYNTLDTNPTQKMQINGITISYGKLTRP